MGVQPSWQDPEAHGGVLSWKGWADTCVNRSARGPGEVCEPPRRLGGSGRQLQVMG